MNLVESFLHNFMKNKIMIEESSDDNLDNNTMGFIRNTENYKLVKCNSHTNNDVDYLVFLKKNVKFSQECTKNTQIQHDEVVKTYKIESASKMQIHLNRNISVVHSIIKAVLDLKTIKDKHLLPENTKKNISQIMINLVLPINKNINEKKVDIVHKKSMLFTLRALLITSYLQKVFIQNGYHIKVLSNCDSKTYSHLQDSFELGDVINPTENDDNSINISDNIDNKYIISQNESLDFNKWINQISMVDNINLNYSNSSHSKSIKDSNDKISIKSIKKSIEIVHISHSNSNSICTKNQSTLCNISQQNPNINIKQLLISCSDVSYRRNDDDGDDDDDDDIDYVLKVRLNQVKSSFISKYGLKETEERFPKGLMLKLAMASIKFEMMYVTSSHDVHLDMHALSQKGGQNFDNSSGIFVMYNYARVCTLLQKYNQLVHQGYYQRLPDLESIDFSCVKLKDEWGLLHNHLSYYPNIVNVSFQHLHTHKLCQYLSSLANSFSKYYSKTRILLDPLPQLASTMHARLHVVLAIKHVVEHAFDLLSITPFTEM